MNMLRCLLRCGALLLALMAHHVIVFGTEAVTPRGALVIAGGALQPQTAEVWQRIVTLAGGKGAAIAVFGAASDDPEKSAASVIATLRRYGARAYFVPVALQLKNTDYRAAARDPKLIALLRKAGGVYFTGGDQGRVTKVLFDDQGDQPGQRTPMLDAIWSVYQRGGVIAGSSAGAAIMSATMFYEPAEHLSILRNGIVPGHDVAAGLGFIGTQWFVDQHFLVRGRFARAIPAMLAAGYTYGLGIDENTAAVVSWKQDRQEIEIVGRAGALMMNLKDAMVLPGADAALNVRNVRLSLLGPGDRIAMSSGAITWAPLKRKLRQIEPDASEQKLYADILGRNVLVEAMIHLIESVQIEAIGLAFDRSTAAGFEFRFYKAADTVGYHTDGFPLEGYSVQDLRLDIAPVTFSQPLYRHLEPTK